MSSPTCGRARRLLRGVSVLSALAFAGPALAAMDWLAVCSKCLSPKIFSRSGIGTAQAMAEARMTQRDAEAWCENWSPGENVRACAKRELSSAEGHKIYRASADCTAGRITPIDGNTYTYAGVWTNDVGRGRSRWRDATGRIVGQDNASNGLAISQQWEVLCPRGLVGGTKRQAPTAAAPAAAVAPTAVFAVGQIVEARYGSAWVRAQIQGLRPVRRGDSLDYHYEVRLENGQRGIVPARMLRSAHGR